MSDKTRKRIWLMPVAAAIGVVAVLAVLAATMWPSSTAQAQEPFLGPDNLMATEVSATQIDLSWSAGLGQDSYEVQRMTGSSAFATVSTATNPGNATTYMDMGLTASTMYTYRVRGVNVDGMSDWSAVAMATTMAAGNGNGTPAGATLESSSNTSSADVKLTLTIELKENLTGSSWVEIYLEDDYQEPGSIAKEDVVFEARGAPTTGGSDVDVDTTFTAADVEIDDGGDLNDEDNAVVISARIPDMKDGDATGYPQIGQILVMVVSDAAGIKNPSEDGNHDNGFSIIGGTDDRADAAQKEDIGIDTGTADNANDAGKLLTKAKISLSADDGGRGKEVTITGSGFNNGTTATVYVLTMANGATSGMSCLSLLADADKVSLGTAVVGSDDKFSVVFTVSNDDFDKGEVNYICARDDEAPDNRPASAVETFDMTPSLSVSPDSANSGEEVTLKPRDFNGGVITVSLDGKETATFDGSKDSPAGGDFTLMKDGTSDYTFDMPGGLSGTVQVSFNQGGDTKRTTIAVDPSNLELSKVEVVPNETIIVSGSGFSEGAEICVGDIKIDGKALKVDDAGTSEDNSATNDIACDGDVKGGRYVSTTSNGEFTTTVSVWAMGDNNPALDDDEYTIKVTDSEGFVGKAKITILEPTVSVMPEMVSPRDFITISGENWPISTADDDHEVKIMVDRRNRSVNIDGNGRFRYEYQLRSNIGIGDEHEVVVEFKSDGGNIKEEATFEVRDAGIMLTPTEAAPGQTISLEIEGMPPYTLVDHVNIDGVNRLGGQNLNTDRHGNVMITGVLVPYLDPGFYPVQVMVGEETRVVQLEVLAEAVVAGVAAALPGAVEDLGENLVRIFHFNTSSKVWTFYDPRPEFEGLNTLTELAAGHPYWILVPETQENVVLNGRPRNLTCVGGDCWNQLVW